MHNVVKTRSVRSDPTIENLPDWVRVQQSLDDTDLGLLQPALAALNTRLAGQRVCLAVGSRGIDRLAEVVAAVAGRVRALGGDPFVTPAMGSHGGATAAGQCAVLERLGITEAACRCPIRAGMDTHVVGAVDFGGEQVPVHVDAIAAGADAVIPINRIKPHTGFSGANESGLAKMLAIGLGNREGAHTFHSRGYSAFAQLIPQVASHVLAHTPVVAGVALVENGYGRLATLDVLEPATLIAREAELLAAARARMARLPFSDAHILIVDRIGKDISGVGMDPNVIGRDHTGRRADGPSIQRIIVRSLTPATAGHAAGIGVADVALQAAVDAIDPHKTHVNSLTAKTPENARIPITAPTDKQALEIALACCVGITPATARIARITDTHHLSRLWVTEPMLADLADCAVVSQPQALTFTQDGMFAETPASPAPG